MCISIFNQIKRIVGFEPVHRFTFELCPDAAKTAFRRTNAAVSRRILGVSLPKKSSYGGTSSVFFLSRQKFYSTFISCQYTKFNGVILPLNKAKPSIITYLGKLEQVWLGCREKAHKVATNERGVGLAACLFLPLKMAISKKQLSTPDLQRKLGTKNPHVTEVFSTYIHIHTLFIYPR